MQRILRYEQKEKYYNLFVFAFQKHFWKNLNFFYFKLIFFDLFRLFWYADINYDF